MAVLYILLLIFLYQRDWEIDARVDTGFFVARLIFWLCFENSAYPPPPPPPFIWNLRVPTIGRYCGQYKVQP